MALPKHIAAQALSAGNRRVLDEWWQSVTRNPPTGPNCGILEGNIRSVDNIELATDADEHVSQFANDLSGRGYVNDPVGAAREAIDSTEKMICLGPEAQDDSEILCRLIPVSDAEYLFGNVESWRDSGTADKPDPRTAVREADRWISHYCDPSRWTNLVNHLKGSSRVPTVRGSLPNAFWAFQSDLGNPLPEQNRIREMLGVDPASTDFDGVLLQIRNTTVDASYVPTGWDAPDHPHFRPTSMAGGVPPTTGHTKDLQSSANGVREVVTRPAPLDPDLPPLRVP